MRQLVLALGVTAEATSCILAVFLGGLALGAYLGGRIADRFPGQALLLYGLAEILVAVSGLLVTAVAPSLPEFVASIAIKISHSQIETIAMRLAVCSVLLLIPTIFMGSSLPFLTRYFVKRGLYAKNFFSKLYGINTLGGAVGSFLTCYVGMPMLGLFGTVCLAAGLNLVVGICASICSFLNFSGSVVASEEHLSKQEESSSADTSPVTHADSQRSISLPLLITLSGLCGYTAIAYEILWTRMLRFSTTSTTYAFSALLTTFLLGLALGSFVYHKLLLNKFKSGHKEELKWFAHLQFITSIFCAASLLCLPASFLLRTTVPQLLGSFIPWQYHHSLQLYITAFLFMLLPATLIGISFPLTTSLATAISKNNISTAVGCSYAANTAGCVLGTAFVGLVLIPLLGSYIAFQITIIFSVLTGSIALIACGQGGKRWTQQPALALPLLLSILFLAFVQCPLSKFLSGLGLLKYGEDIAGTVMVMQCPGYKQLIMNGEGYSSTIMRGRRYMRMLGQLPVLMNPKAKDVCVICFGMGTTAGALALNDQIETEDIVELSPLVINYAGLFTDTNFDVLRNPRVKVHIDDGRNFLLMCGKQYDAITLEPPPPAEAGVTNLYSREFYALARKHLKEGGVLCQWAPMHTASGKLWKMMVSAAQSEFKDVSLWETNNSECILLCTDSPLKIDLESLSKNMQDAKIKASLSDVGMGEPESLLSTFISSDSAMRKYTAAEAAVTDDGAQIEFFLPYTDNRLYNFDLEEVSTDVKALFTDKRASVDNAALKNAREAMRLMRAATKARVNGMKDQASKLLNNAEEISKGNAFFDYAKSQAELVLD